LPLRAETGHERAKVQRRHENKRNNCFLSQFSSSPVPTLTR
jgi:hypothetical protein